VFDKISLDVLSPFKGQSYSITSKEAPWSKEDSGYLIRFKEGYFPVPPQDTLMDYRNEVVITLENDFGIPCEAHHHEVATAGQCEIDMVRDTLTKMADNVVTLKYVAKEYSVQKKSGCNFLAKANLWRQW
jgi:Glutamine synthetase